MEACKIYRARERDSHVCKIQYTCTPARGVSSFMVSWTRRTAGSWIDRCKKDRIQKPIWITGSINIKIAIYICV
jgi:hypothetical protein